MESDDVVRYGVCKQNVVVTPSHKDSESNQNTLLIGSLIIIVQQVDPKYIGK